MNFITEDEPDLFVEVIRSKIPDKEGRRIFRRDNHECFIKDGEELYYSSYYSGTDDIYIDYALLKKQDEGRYTLLVDYPELWDTMIFEALNFSELLIERNVVLLHSSCVEFDGGAILFTAKKQVGKSTQAALWEKFRGARIINGDRMALRFIDGSLFACGTPYRGSSKISENRELPVKLIACISQGTKNEIRPLSSSDAYLRLFEGVSCDYQLEKIGEKASELIEQIVSSARIVSFSCTPDECAVDALYNELY